MLVVSFPVFLISKNRKKKTTEELYPPSSPLRLTSRTFTYPTSLRTDAEAESFNYSHDTEEEPSQYEYRSYSSMYWRTYHSHYLVINVHIPYTCIEEHTVEISYSKVHHRHYTYHKRLFTIDIHARWVCCFYFNIHIYISYLLWYACIEGNTIDIILKTNVHLSIDIYILVEYDAFSSILTFVLVIVLLCQSFIRQKHSVLELE